MSFKAPKPFVVVIPEENILKKIIKSLEKENTDLRSNLVSLRKRRKTWSLTLKKKSNDIPSGGGSPRGTVQEEEGK